MAFELPKLKYAFDALEPHIDARTMEIHHDKHHAGYTSKLNAAIAGTDSEGKTIENILENLDKTKTAVRNNGGGYYNHNLYWEIMSPNGGGKPEGKLAKAIDLSLIHISEPTRLRRSSYAVFCLKKKKKEKKKKTKKVYSNQQRKKYINIMTR